MSDLRATIELSPGVHRVEKVRNDKLHGYHVLETPSGPVPIDPGYRDAPVEVYEPFLNDNGWELSDVSMAIITHEDADHHGGNNLLREHSPDVTLVAHEAGAGWIEDNDRMMTEVYGMFEEDHDVAFSEDVKTWLTDMMGPAEPVDLRFKGGERVRVKDRHLTVLHTPGHRKGHIMLHDPEYGVLIGGDGILGRGVQDVNGTFIEPPPYWLYPEYENSIKLVDALRPETLSLTHYDLIEGTQDVVDFVDESLSFVHELEAVALDLVHERGTVTLQEGIEAATERIGDLGLNTDYGMGLYAHYTDRVESGELEVTRKDGVVAWTTA
jgi:glyoxylase-like metal-dependent hydrolase (beta-lactamase superfamily II)